MEVSNRKFSRRCEKSTPSVFTDRVPMIAEITYINRINIMTS